MKVKIERAKFVEALKRVKGAVVSKGTLPILSTVKLTASAQELTVAATDLEHSASVGVPCEVIGEGATCAPHAKLVGILGRLDENEVTLRLDKKEQLHLVAGITQTRLSCSKEGEFPKMPTLDDPGAGWSLVGAVPGLDLRDALKRTMPATAHKGAGRDVYEGVCWQSKGSTIRFLASDGRRLHCVGVATKDAGAASFSESIPRAKVASGFFEDDEEVNIYVREHEIALESDGALVTLRAVPLRYPDILQAVPEFRDPTKGFGCLTVNASELKTALDIAACIARQEDNKPIWLGANEEGVSVSAMGDGTGEHHDQVDGRMKDGCGGSSWRFGCAYKFASDAIKALDGAEQIEVWAKCGEPTYAATVWVPAGRSGDPLAPLVVVMPIDPDCDPWGGKKRTLFV